MSKHTAGEWVVHRGEICYRSTEDDQSYGMLCPVDLSDESNLNLISAAPELLSSSETALNYIEAVCFNTPNEKKRRNYADCAAILRAAIAKATGGE